MLAALSQTYRAVQLAQLSHRQRVRYHGYRAGIGGGCEHCRAILTGAHCSTVGCKHWHGVCCDPRNPVQMRRRAS